MGHVRPVPILQDVPPPPPPVKFDIKCNFQAIDALVNKDEGNVDGDSSTDNDDDDSPPNKKQRKLPMQGESTKYKFASEDDLHKMTHSNLLNGLDTWDMHMLQSCYVFTGGPLSNV
jgi:hypothetical protein